MSIQFHKSTHSGDTGNCVEVGVFKKSTHSGSGGSCVEALRLEDGDVVVRDSKNPEGGVLRYTPAEWVAFIAGVKDGEFDLST